LEFAKLNTGYALQEEGIGKTDRVLQIEDINKEIKIITKFDFKSTRKSSANLQSADEIPENPKEYYAIETGVQTKVLTEGEINSDTPVLSADETASELSPEIKYAEKALQDDDGSIFKDNGIKTQLCGIFYLINLMRELDLPECFEEDFGLSSQVGAWGTLELLARGIIGTDERFKTDPIWDILARLDGRKDGALMGNQMNGSGTYKMPQLWFEKCKQKRDSGFFWSDEAPVEGLEGELPGISSHLSRLMTCIMPFIRWYLKLALDPEAKKEKPEMDMLICNGRLYLTSTFIDIMMKLQDISIPTRMAGLDADPGWAAEFGRVVKFHFE